MRVGRSILPSVQEDVRTITSLAIVFFEKPWGHQVCSCRYHLLQQRSTQGFYCVSLGHELCHLGTGAAKWIFPPISQYQRTPI